VTTLKDWLTFAVTLIGAFGWFFGWWKHRELKTELRGVRGWKFRAMYRDFAMKHDLPLNGEDTD
jgi:hypothetical protein